MLKFEINLDEVKDLDTIAELAVIRKYTDTTTLDLVLYNCSNLKYGITFKNVKVDITEEPTFNVTDVDSNLTITGIYNYNNDDIKFVMTSEDINNANCEYYTLCIYTYK